MNILFVCTGNTCRSPMAAAILQDKNDQLTVKSAGIYASDGDQANPNTQAVLRMQNIAYDHEAKKLTTELMDWADLVLTMTRSHQLQLLDAYPSHEEKVFSLHQYVTANHADVMDPFGQSLPAYEATYAVLDDLLSSLVEKIQS